MVIQTQIETDYPADPKYHRVPLGSLPSSCNSRVLFRELNDLSLSVNIDSVHSFLPNSIVVILSGSPTAGDVSLINSTVAAHGGQPFEETKRAWFNGSVVQAPFNSQVESLIASGNMFESGDYSIEWYAELRISDITAGTYAKAVFHYNTNNQTAPEAEGPL